MRPLRKNPVKFPDYTSPRSQCRYTPFPSPGPTASPSTPPSCRFFFPSPAAGRAASTAPRTSRPDRALTRPLPPCSMPVTACWPSGNSADCRPADWLSSEELSRGSRRKTWNSASRGPGTGSGKDSSQAGDAQPGLTVFPPRSSPVCMPTDAARSNSVSRVSIRKCCAAPAADTALTYP